MTEREGCEVRAWEASRRIGSMLKLAGVLVALAFAAQRLGWIA